LTTPRTDAAPAVPLAIVGIGCLFPKADGPAAFWANIKNRVDCITPVPPTHWSVADYFDPDPKVPDRTYARRGGFLDPVPFPPGEFGIAPNSLEATDTSQLLGLVVAQRALDDAGIPSVPSPERERRGGPEPVAHAPGSDGQRGAIDRNRVSVILGVTGTLELVIPLGARLGHPHWKRALEAEGLDPDTVERVVNRIGDSYVAWQENSFPGLLGNVVAGRIANRLDLGGTNCVVDAACASSLSALHLATLELAAGRADVVLTGGVDTFNDIFMHMCFSKTPALSPTGDAKPFDAAGDGTILGEGLGILVLKRLSDAERDGDRVYAVIKGIGTSSDGKGNAIYAPVAAGQVKALRAAYRQAGVSPATVELVEGHGTGTRVGDGVEVEALTEVYGEASRGREPPEGPWCALGSVKSQVGHTKAAAGAAGLIKAALALHHKVLPPTIKVKQPLEALAADKTPFYVNTEKRPWLPNPAHPRRAAVSAFGFGGSNYHCVLEEYRPEKTSVDWDGDVQLLAFSGDTVDQLQAQLTAFPANLSWAEFSERAEQSRADFRTDHACRLTTVVPRDADAGKLLANARTQLTKQADRTTWHTPDGIAFGRGAPAGKLGVLFPGQGSQSVGMLRDLACQFPVFLQVLAEADRVFAEDGADGRLGDFIYPQPAFTPEAKAAQEQALRSTRVAQPAIGAVSLGALGVLDQFGVRPETTAGHSYGELLALCAAGCYDAPTLHTISRLRGRLMAERGEADGDPGAMLAVHAPLEAIEGLIRGERLDLVVANKNAPSQSVLSGPTAEVERAAAAFAARQVRTTRLPVAAAFHSELVADAQRPFREALERVAFRPPRLPVFANSSARQYPDAPQQVRELLAGQLARPVDFVEEIVNMAASGVRTFLEVGPGSTLTRLVEAILSARTPADDGHPWAALALDASGGKRPGIHDLALALGRLAALGHPVRLTEWERRSDRRPAPPNPEKPTLTVPICGANYVKPKPKPEPKPMAAPTTRPAERPPPPAPVVRAPEPQAASPTPIAPAPVPAPAPAAAPPAFAQALQMTQDSLLAFTRMQEQTAALHKQFLETQETAHRTLHTLVEQQQRLLMGSLGMAVPAPSAVAPMAPPAPAPVLPAPTPVTLPEAVRVVSPNPPSPFPLREGGAQGPSAGDRLQRRVLEPGSPPPLRGKGDGGLGEARVESVLRAVVAEKTGYPREMLELDMGLDADLGIDSIKRVEILSALQEKLPDAHAVKPEHLGTLHTLRHIVAFLAGGDGTAAAVAPPSVVVADTEPTALAPAGLPESQVEEVLRSVVAEKTGYPPEMLELDMGLDADLGIDSIKRVEILSALQERLPDAPAVKPEHLGTLHTLRHIARFLAGGTTPQTAPPPAAEPAPAPQPVASGAPPQRSVLRAVPLDRLGDRPRIDLPGGAVVWVVGDDTSLSAALSNRLRVAGLSPQPFAWSDAPPDLPTVLGALVLLAPERADEAALLAGFRWLRHAAPALRRSGAAFLTVTRLGGAFGLESPDPAADPLTGGLAGLAKTARHEWPEVNCKAIDLAPDLTPDGAAEAVAEELFVTGPTEVGVTWASLRTLDLTPAPLPDGVAPSLTPSDVIVVSGGARGVTAEAALALARAGRPTLVLLGRSPEPGPEPDWLAPLSDEAEIKRALATRLNGDATPRRIGEQFQRLTAQREVRQNLARLAAAGARVLYRSADVRDAAAVAAALDAVREEVGPITGLVHGAGVLADRKIEDKTDEQFAAVLATKVGGARALLAATANDPLRFLAFFSSSTGRFGRTGQVDYAVANEALNKLAQAEARRRPDCRVVAVNWGPWDGGMVNAGLAKLFAGEGIPLIPLEAGARHLVAELAAPDRAVEVVVMGPAGKTAGLTAPARQEPANLAVAFERDLDPDSHPVLRSHVIDGRAVLPMALHVEWLAHAAMHGQPGLALHGFDELRVLGGVLLGADGPLRLRVLAGKATRQDGLHRVPVELRSLRADGRETVHSRASILLANELPRGERRLPTIDARPYPHPPEAIYTRLLFHGPDLQAITAVDGWSPAGITVHAPAAPAPSAWLRRPLRGTWLTDPLALDCAFQAATLWSYAAHGTAALPMFAGRYRQFRRSFPAGGVRVDLRVTKDAGGVTRMDVEFADPASGELVARMDDFECVGDAKFNEAFRRNRLPERQAAGV
jgi:acyl transferase domain-containing protein/acyl carrier protein